MHSKSTRRVLTRRSGVNDSNIGASVLMERQGGSQTGWTGTHDENIGL